MNEYRLVCERHPDASVGVYVKRDEFPHPYATTTVFCEECHALLATHDRRDFGLVAPGRFIERTAALGAGDPWA